MQPVGEASSSAAAVAAKQIVSPVLGEVVNGVGIATIHGRLADDPAMALVVTVAFPSKGVLHFRSMFTASVHVEPSRISSGRACKRHTSLQNMVGLGGLGRRVPPARQRFLVVALHRFHEPCLDHRTRTDVALTEHEPFRRRGRGTFKSGRINHAPWPESEVGSAGSWGPHEHALREAAEADAKLKTDHADDDSSPANSATSSTTSLRPTRRGDRR